MLQYLEKIAFEATITRSMGAFSVDCLPCWVLIVGTVNTNKIGHAQKGSIR